MPGACSANGGRAHDVKTAPTATIATILIHLFIGTPQMRSRIRAEAAVFVTLVLVLAGAGIWATGARKSFCVGQHNFSGLYARRSNNHLRDYMFCDELTGDFGNGLEASGGTPSGQAAVPRLTRPSGRCQDIRGVPRSTQQEALVRLRQAAVRGSESRARLSVTVYASCCHLEPSPDRSRPAHRHVQGQGLH